LVVQSDQENVGSNQNFYYVVDGMTVLFSWLRQC